MKRTLISTAAAALLLASHASVMAQQRDRGDGPGGNPGAQAPGPGPGAQPGPGRDAGPPANRPEAPNPGERRGPPANAPKAETPAPRGPVNTPKAERPDRPAQQRAEPKAPAEPNQQKQQRTDEQKQSPTPRADVKGKDADKNRATRDDAPKADGRDGQRKDADRAAQDKGRTDRTADKQDLRQARERLDNKERVRLHDAFDRRQARVNVRVDLTVGRRIPRNVRLVRVPQTVIAFFPSYRDYSYFAVGETICIVDPRTYEVVDVIDEGYRNGQPTQQARLSLDPAQMALVRESISPDRPAERINLRLALGAEIPRDVELHRFEPRVIDTVRELERYRFVLVEDEIVIVDPGDRSIALVVDRR